MNRADSGSKVWKPAEFMPFAEREEVAAQTPEEISNMMRGIGKGGG